MYILKQLELKKKNSGIDGIFESQKRKEEQFFFGDFLLQFRRKSYILVKGFGYYKNNIKSIFNVHFEIVRIKKTYLKTIHKVRD